MMKQGEGGQVLGAGVPPVYLKPGSLSSSTDLSVMRPVSLPLLPGRMGHE